MKGCGRFRCRRRRPGVRGTGKRRSLAKFVRGEGQRSEDSRLDKCFVFYYNAENTVEFSMKILMWLQNSS